MSELMNRSQFLNFFGLQRLIAIFIFCTSGCQMRAPELHRKPASEALPITDEAFTELRLSLPLTQKLVDRLVKSQGQLIERLDPVAFSATNGLVNLSGAVKIPQLIKTLGFSADPKPDSLANTLSQTLEDLESVEFQVAFVPRVRVAGDESYLNIELKSVRLNGQEMMGLFPVVANVAGAFLADERMQKFVKNRAQDVSVGMPDGSMIPLHVARLFEKKNIQFAAATNTLSINLVMDQIVDLDRFEDLDGEEKNISNLRLWYFGPTRFSGTSASVFYVAVGVGHPSERWLHELETKRERDTLFLVEGMQEELKQYGDTQALTKEVQAYRESMMKHMGVASLSPREKSWVDGEVSDQIKLMQQRLNRDAPLFLASPRDEYARLREELKSQTVLMIEDMLHRREDLAQADSSADLVRGAGRWPVVEQFVSQKTLTHIVQFFRDMSFDESRPFRDLSVVISPKLPGLKVRGILNLSLAKMEFLSGDSNLDLGAKIDAATQQNLPFELSVRLLMQPNGWLRVNVVEGAFFKGTQRLAIKNTQNNGKFLIALAEKLIVKTLASSLLKVGSENLEARFSIGGDLIRKRQEKLSALVRSYAELQAGEHTLPQLMAFDVKKNPFIEISQEGLEHRLAVSLKDLIKNDGRSLLLALNPAAIRALGLEDSRPMSFWNLDSLYLENLKRNFLDLAVGYGNRSESYHVFMKTRLDPNSAESDHFEKHFAPNAVDFSMILELSDLTTVLNPVLSGIRDSMNRSVDQALLDDKAQTLFRVNDLHLGSASDGALEVDLTLSIVRKVSRSYLNPARYTDGIWRVDELPVAVKAWANLRVDDIKKFADKIPIKDRAVFLGSKVLVVDVIRASIASGSYKTFQTILSLAGHGLDSLDFKKSPLEQVVKELLVRCVVDNVLDNAKDEGNTKINGVPLNRSVRVYNVAGNLLIQVNPRVAYPAFDVTVLPSQKVGGNWYGLRVDPSKNTLSLDFSTSAAMAASDREEIMNIVTQANSIFAPLENARTATEFEALSEKAHLRSALFINADKTQSDSLFHRLGRILKYYPELSKTAARDSVTVDEAEETGQRTLSECGVELVYFASGVFSIYDGINRYEKKVKELGLEEKLASTQEYKLLLKKRDELYVDYLKPQLDTYESRFRAKNESFVRRGRTDWNESFLPDALFADAASRSLRSQIPH